MLPGNSAAPLFPVCLPICPIPGFCTRPALHLPDVVGHHTHTHSPRRQNTRQYKPCPLETVAAGVEGARRCCVSAAADPIACGVRVGILKYIEFPPRRNPHNTSLIGAVFFRSTNLPRKSHIRQEQSHPLVSNAMLLCLATGVPDSFRDRQRSGVVPKTCQKQRRPFSAAQQSSAVRSKLFLHEYESNTHTRHTSPTGLARRREE